MALQAGVLAIAMAALLSVSVCGDAIPYPTPAPTVVIGSGNHEEYLVSLPDGEPQLIFHSDRPSFLMWSPSGDRFVYILDGEVLVFDPTNPLRPIARAPAAVGTYPIAWSDEGDILLITSSENSATIWTMDDETSKTQEIFTKEGVGASISFVGWLDEHTALVTEPERGVSELAIYDVRSGTRTTTGIEPIGFGAGPAISPDRSEVAWSDHCGYPGANDGIWLAEVATWTPRKINNACGLTYIAWSPDGAELAFTAEYTTVHEKPEDTGGLYVINLQSEQVRRITDPSPIEINTFEPRVIEPVELQIEWLPGGTGFRVLRDLARCSDCRGARSFLVNADGSQETPVMEPIDSADGVGELRIKDSGMWFEPASGSAPRLLLRAQPDWGISGRLAPNGRWATLSHSYCPLCYP